MLFALLVALPASSSAHLNSAGVNLATSVKALFPKVDLLVDVPICVLGDNPSPSWNALLDDFLGELFTEERFMVGRITKLSDARVAKFKVYLIFLSELLDSDSFGGFVHDLLLSKYWNRYGKFIFVSALERDDAEQHHLVQYLYRATVKFLGIVNSIHMSLNEENAQFMVYAYDYFNRRGRFLEESKTVENVLSRDKLKDVNGYAFLGGMYVNLPYCYINGSKIDGSDQQLMAIFAEQINGSFYTKIDLSHEREFLSNEFINKRLSILNVYKQVPYYTEVSVATSFNGFCLMIPEKIIGTIYSHLMRPFHKSVWVALGGILVACVAVGYKFRKAFPRGIVNQLFHGALITDYEMGKVERSTMFSLTVLLFLITSAYEAKLFQLLFDDEYEPHIRTVQELNHTNYDIYVGMPEFKQYLKNHISNRLLSASNRSQDFYYNTVQFRPCSFTNAYVASNWNMNPATGKKRFYVMEENFIHMNTLFTHSRLEPFSRKFSLIHRMLIEAGIMDHLADKIYTTAFIKSYNILTYEDLISLWKLLAIGYGLAIVTFLLEAFWKTISCCTIKTFNNVSSCYQSMAKNHHF